MATGLVWLALASATAAAAQPVPDPNQLARRFAPVLVFHPAETFFPSNPHPVAQGVQSRGRDDAPSESDGDGTPGTSPVAERIRAYLDLSREEKLARATVFYRVSTMEAEHGPRLVIEYFLYYLRNPYRTRGGLFPIGFNLTHPHDLERVRVVVRWPRPADGPETLADPIVEGVYPSAHGPDVPDTVVRSRGGRAIAPPIRILVEFGSHAMATDLDGDGRFTPAGDGSEPRKFLWGIRDHGAAWWHYRPSYMEARDDATAVVLRGPPDAHATPRSSSAAGPVYRLEPIDTLLTGLLWVNSPEAEAIDDDRASWAVRLFGDASRQRVLTLPPPPATPEEGTTEATAARAERGSGSAS